MSEQRQDKGRGRRDVLKLASLGSVAAAAVTIAGKGEALAAQKPAGGSGYRETEHVQRYDATARF